MTTIVKAANAAHFLSLVPHMLGFRPLQSLVLIPFQGSRSLGAMRVDLPDAASDAVDRIASTVIGMVCRLPDADAVAAVVYTDSLFSQSGGMPHHGLLRAIERRADTCGLRVTDLMCVAGDGWGSLFDPECPESGRPKEEIVQLHEASDAASSLSGPPPDPDQASGAALPEVGRAEKDAVAVALAAVDDLLVAMGDGGGSASGSAATEPGRAPSDTTRGTSGIARIHPQAIAAAHALDDLPSLYEEALGWNADAPAPYDVAVLAWCLARPSLRDIALVQWSGRFADGDEALEAQLRWEEGEEYPAHLAMQMWGEGERPDSARLLAALAVTRRVAASVPRETRPGALAMCAWLAWALGRSTHADHYARAACAIEPEHGLSEIVRSFVAAGHLPDWAFSDRARKVRR